MDVISDAVATGAPVVVLTGPETGGLARRWVEAHYPMSHLAVDFTDYRLRYGVPLSEVLRQCLLALEAVNPPMTLFERRIMYRAYVQRRGRMAIGLDNADQAAQVRPFVVPGSVVVVSSRRRLGGLVTDKAHFLNM